MKRVLCVMIVILLASSFSSIAFAGGPKCPCFKAKDLEKLMKKDYFIMTSQEVNYKEVTFRTPEWDYSMKGKGVEIWFGWQDDTFGEPDGVVEDVWWTGAYQDKWKGQNYWDDKTKGKGRPVETGSEDSAECAAILENFINMVD